LPEKFCWENHCPVQLGVEKNIDRHEAPEIFDGISAIFRVFAKDNSDNPKNGQENSASLLKTRENKNDTSRQELYPPWNATPSAHP
jgi:hypothetical protein